MVGRRHSCAVHRDRRRRARSPPCFLLWPNFEPQRLPQEMSDAIAAQGRYAAAVLSNLLGETAVATVERARREARPCHQQSGSIH